MNLKTLTVTGGLLVTLLNPPKTLASETDPYAISDELKQTLLSYSIPTFDLPDIDKPMSDDEYKRLGCMEMKSAIACMLFTRYDDPGVVISYRALLNKQRYYKEISDERVFSASFRNLMASLDDKQKIGVIRFLEKHWDNNNQQGLEFSVSFDTYGYNLKTKHAE